MSSSELPDTLNLTEVFSTLMAVTEFPSEENTTALHKTVKAQLLLYDIFIPLLGIFIIIINGAVVLSSGLLIGRRVEPKATYLFLGNIAAADILTALATLTGQFFPRHLRTQFICAMLLCSIVGATLVSIWSIALIAVDRFLFIVHGMHYKQWMYSRRARILILMTWIVGLGVGYLPAMGWANTIQPTKQCWYIKLVTPAGMLLTTTVGILPLFLILALYSSILYNALRKVSQLQRAYEESTRRTKNPPQNKTKSPTKWKAIKVVLFTTGAFCVTWVPYFTACIIYVFCKTNCRPIEIAIATWLAILGFSNSLINPIIYAWWHPGFRNFMKKICFWKQTKTINRTGTESSSNKSKGSSTTSFNSRDITTDEPEDTKL